ncbi:MAG: carbohydrate binding domain-containing protein [Kiritimatiellae bacterium]|nr:carbohydrate binding domain-containing protein [Kiritimatiellia bacterium]
MKISTISWLAIGLALLLALTTAFLALKKRDVRRGADDQPARAAAVEPDAREYINLLQNGDFEITGENAANLPAGWKYHGGEVPAKLEPARPGRKGGQCLYLHSGQTGYHSGPIQTTPLKGNRRYKFSVWAKAGISKDGGRVRLLYCDGRYPLVLNGRKTNKYWSSGGRSYLEKKESFDWQYFEKTFETPSTDATNAYAVGELPANNVIPFLLYDQAKVWAEDARLADLGDVFKLRYEDRDAWLADYKRMYKEYDEDFYNHIVKFTAAIGWEELRKEAAEIDGFSAENIERTRRALAQAVSRLSELDFAKANVLRKRLFAH